MYSFTFELIDIHTLLYEILLKNVKNSIYIEIQFNIDLILKDTD